MKAGTSSDTEEIWKRFRGDLRGFISKRIRDSAQVDDILQDVFIKIHKRIEDLTEAKSLKSWIFQITQNAITDFYRKQGRSLETNSEGDVDSTADEKTDLDTPERHESREQVLSAVQSMMECLSEDDRAILWRIEAGEVSQVELASELGMTVPGAKSRVQRARTKLKKLLLACCDFERDSRHRVTGLKRKKPNDCC
jgi:RNA polymerase sigma-70 factor (ECF subfamily)